MKHEELLSKLTPEEKAALLSGKTVWQTRDIPRLKTRPFSFLTVLTASANRQSPGIIWDKCLFKGNLFSYSGDYR